MVKIAGQGNRHTTKAVLTCILDAVAINVVPDRVADGAAAGVAEINPICVFANAQGIEGCRVRRAGSAVQVVGGVAPSGSVLATTEMV